ncbi:DUF1460 domain-containing protein [Porphyromonadaceae bacterium OttesenSCG-928-L07]|nr:DUF1460 domain-containing protein [Porphyromonadaceae bacterium OttesenSCG-928-L07]MDL2252118.1 DUF1460 domain-containing protein [Odoribacter sp. OttesenSCG-928-J03]MDL2330744.1 DUF1460 domain-containing protein [Odoribacter sp. OttesenSCG-928-A06]
MKRVVVICLCCLLCGLRTSAIEISPADSAVFKAFWQYAAEQELYKLSVSKRIPLIGLFFLGTPYQGGTLNTCTEELPVINLRELDCVTFVEVTMALAFLEKYDENSIEPFVRNLIKLRYRNAEIVDYTSRLHYSSDWLYEIDRTGIVRDVTAQAGGEKCSFNVSFMTENPSRYPALKNAPQLQKKMKGIEAAINRRTYHYIPQDKIGKSLYKIKSGDVVLITTNIKGLDTSHVGFAILVDGKMHLLHASLTEKKVVVSENMLHHYVLGNARQTGIMLARVHPVEEMFLEN